MGTGKQYDKEFGSVPKRLKKKIGVRKRKY